MKKLVGLFFIILIAFSVSAQHVYKHSAYQIVFPDEPTENQQTVETAVGDIIMYSVMYEGTEAVYMLAYSDYPEQHIKNSNSTDLLNNAKGGFIGNLGLEVTFENEISIKGNPGIYFKGEGNSYYAVMKDYLVKNRLYQIGILRVDKYANEKEIDGFINTFKLK